MLPVLEALARRYEETSVPALEDEVFKALRLPPAERTRRSPSGNHAIFSNRLNWARTYLAKAGLIEGHRRGYFRATDLGRALLAEGVSAIDIALLERYPDFAAWRGSREPEGAAPAEVSPDNPEESIASSVEVLNADLAREIVARVYSFSPAFLERLIVDLLAKMGYGGGRLESCRTLGRTGDGGVDGVIYQDALGLDVVYVQAKRLHPENGVLIREVRDFVGGLEANRATKGVFVTTSYFPSTAYDLITRVSKRVVLVDGVALAGLMIRHQVGVRTKGTYVLKRIDEDYFVE